MCIAILAGVLYVAFVFVVAIYWIVTKRREAVGPHASEIERALANDEPITREGVI